MAYRIAVLDDEVRELQKTKEMLFLYGETHPEHGLKISCYSELGKFMETVCGGEGKEEWDFDILLMDIYLPDGNGIEGAKILRQKGFQGVIIFKSSSRDNVIEACSVDALQYLVKPVSQEKLDRTIGKAIKDVRICPVRKTEEETDRQPDSGICYGKSQKDGQPLRYIIDTIFTKWKQRSRHER